MSDRFSVSHITDDSEQVQPFRPRPRNDFLTGEDVAAGLRWATVERNRGDSAAADRILIELHQSAIRTWGVGHRQIAPIEAAVHRWNVRIADAEAALAGCTGAPEPAERGDIALRMAQARQWLAHEGGTRMGMPVPAWDGLTPAEQELAELEARHWINAAVNAGVKIVPAGCTVVALPDPDETDEYGPAWNTNSDLGIRVEVNYGDPAVWDRDRDMTPEDAEQHALALLAAAREARRLAAEQPGSQVGDQHG